MKVLHLPTNIATQVSVSVRALRDLGVEARGLVWNTNVITDTAGIESFECISRKSHPVRGSLRTLRWWRAVFQAIRWADVIHWHFGRSTMPFSLGVKYAAWLGKPRLVEFWGSDVRIPEIASVDNAYVARLFRQHPEEIGLDGLSPQQIQKRFARLGFACLVPGAELRQYILPEVFPRIYFTEPRLEIGDYTARYPDVQRSCPLVVHAPSHTAIKGTEAVLRAVEELQKTCQFEFRLIHGMPREHAMSIVQQCDVFLDQFVLGSFGMASLEAMAFGKPVVCYLKPSVVALLPQELPIVNATEDNLSEVLRELLGNGMQRNELGQRGRAYVEKHHDAHAVARGLIEVYEDLCAKQRAGVD